MATSQHGGPGAIQGLSRSWQLIRTLLSVYYAYMVEYRAELMFWVLSGSFPLILMGLWNEAASSGQFELEAVTLVRYFLAVFLVRQFTVVWVIWDFEKEVVEGKLSPLLLQPLDPVWRHVAGHVAERAARLPFILALIGLFFLLYPHALWWPSITGWIWGGLGIVLAFGLRFLMQYTYALLAFWIERAAAVEQLSFLLYIFFSGMVAPLPLFPEIVRNIVLWTPFPYLIYFPAALLVGLPVELGRGLGVISLWSLGFWGLNRWLWQRGLRRYSGMGA
ncbi:MAG: ABC-2 family transporter protein [Cyanobacteria bacterium J06632_22]